MYGSFALRSRHQSVLLEQLTAGARYTPEKRLARLFNELTVRHGTLGAGWLCEMDVTG